MATIAKSPSPIPKDNYLYLLYIKVLYQRYQKQPSGAKHFEGIGEVRGQILPQYKLKHCEQLPILGLVLLKDALYTNFQCSLSLNCNTSFVSPEGRTEALNILHLPGYILKPVVYILSAPLKPISNRKGGVGLRGKQLPRICKTLGSILRWGEEVWEAGAGACNKNLTQNIPLNH